MAEYVSHIVGSITEHEYEVIDKPLSPEFLKVFKPNRRIVPGVLIIEKRFGGKTLVGKQIEDYLLSLGFTKSASKNAMRVFSANKWVNEHLEKEGYPIEDLAYTKPYAERVRILFPGKLLIDTRWAREDTIFVRPLQVPEEEIPEMPEVKKRSTLFMFIDGLYQEINQVQYVYFAINHKDTLPYESAEYDHAMDSIRSMLNEWALNAFRKKNPEYELNEAEKPSEDTRRNEEVPDHRIYEFELIDQIEEVVRYKLVYEKGKFTTQKMSKSFNYFELALELERIGVWET